MQPGNLHIIRTTLLVVLAVVALLLIVPGAWKIWSLSQSAPQAQAPIPSSAQTTEERKPALLNLSAAAGTTTSSQVDTQRMQALENTQSTQTSTGGQTGQERKQALLQLQTQ